MALTLAFVMDPLDRVSPDVDTSFAFMFEAHSRGHRVLHVLPSEVGLRSNVCLLGGRDVEVRDEQQTPFEIRETVHLEAAACDAIFVRTDPPFDQEYLTVTWMLSFAERAGVRVINSPRGLRAANEKLYALHWPELCPRTIVSNSHDEISRFIDAVGGEAVLKPVDGHGGYGVVRVKAGDPNIHALIDMLTLEGKVATVAQEYLPAAEQGDKRLFVVNGELRACILRVPQAGDFRSNVHVGGRVEGCALSDADRQIVAAMGDRLRADGLYFVGLDVIGGKLSEVNVTSPTLIRELARLGGPDLAAEVLDSVEATAG
jgi:glutathione synthase